VKGALKTVDGIGDMAATEVDIAAKTVTCMVDASKFDADKAVAAIKEAGFENASKKDG